MQGIILGKINLLFKKYNSSIVLELDSKTNCSMNTQFL